MDTQQTQQIYYYCARQCVIVLCILVFLSCKTYCERVDFWAGNLHCMALTGHTFVLGLDPLDFCTTLAWRRDGLVYTSRTTRR